MNEGAPLSTDGPPPEVGAPDDGEERKRALVELAACVALIVATQLASLPLGMAFGEEFGPLELGALVLVVHGGMFFGVRALLKRRGAGLESLGCAPPPRGWLRTCLLVPPALILMWIVVFPVAWLARGSDALDQQLPIAASSPAWIPVYAAISCVVGFVEELVFRGLLLRRLRTYLESRGVRRAYAWAIVVSSLGFGLLHGLEPVVIAVTATIGLYLALVTRREGGNLALAMLLHAAQDTIGLALRSTT